MKQPTRQRLSHQARRQQLISAAWNLVREQGSDALTLGRVAEEAGVSKPVVYDHFGTRHGLLAALYEDFDLRQNAIIEAAMNAAGASLVERANVVASSYVDCVLTQGREIPDVLSALDSSPELAEVKRKYQLDFIEKFRGWFAEATLPQASMWGMLGAADAISNAVVGGDISQQQGLAELQALILALVERHQ
ncbi:TetR/AcrR family transcriptional regulator [Pantoea trifolii]|uniref:TetR/AcrR family transcriptional regulator n=1 Tax=Pantoea trifolii TaxID=2968030 RepID=A0ABT1VTH6_9GAMM|nr:MULTISPECIES: TetR/AcrR family transcriptional regulator [unclassified Pantoea]MCQ8230177.1 TetR/AcrR family transcriptional regulator [Pantoea sp. MMK2]MCQ8238891.1 TetR/AcrR family transcriptional regulator [Pantoea sp. MMK3]